MSLSRTVVVLPALMCPVAVWLWVLRLYGWVWVAPAFFTPHTTVKYTPVPETATPGAGGGAVESHVATNGNGGDGAADTGAGAGIARGVDAAANGQDDSEGTDVEAATGGDTGNGAAPAAAMPPPRAPRTFVSGCKVAALVLVVAMVVTACIGGTVPADDAAASPSAAAASPGMATGPRFHLTPFCRAELNHGGWRAEDGTQGCAWLPPPMRSAGPHPSPPPVYTATPRPYQWLWKPFGGSAARACGFHLYDGAAALSVLDGGKAVFIGDSVRDGCAGVAVGLRWPCAVQVLEFDATASATAYMCVSACVCVRIVAATAREADVSVHCAAHGSRPRNAERATRCGVSQREWP